MRSLTADGALGIALDDGTAGFAARWLPQDRGARAAAPRATLRVTIGPAAEAPSTLPTLTVGPVRGWMSDRHLILRGAAASGEVDLDAGRVVLRVPADAGDPGEEDVYGMLTIGAGVLLAGLGRALIHGAAVAPSEAEGAWILLGDSGSGKSTTCATLCRAGWSYLSDDQVILSPAVRGLTVEGWVRPFHLDGGWERGEHSGTREARRPDTLFPGRARETASLAGVLLPRVAARQKTGVTPADPADVLAELVRQSPWVLLDRGSAPVVLDLLTTAASRVRPPFRLSLGGDSYGAPERLAAAVAPVLG